MPHLVPGWPSPRSQALPHLIPVCHHVGLLILIYLRLLRRQGAKGAGGAGCGVQKSAEEEGGGPAPWFGSLCHRSRQHPAQGGSCRRMPRPRGATCDGLPGICPPPATPHPLLLCLLHALHVELLHPVCLLHLKAAG